jgi:hypothetical protein
VKAKTSSRSRRTRRQQQTQNLTQLHKIASGLGLALLMVNNKFQITEQHRAANSTPRILCLTASAAQARQFLQGVRFAAERARRPCALCAQMETDPVDQRTKARIVMGCAYASQRWVWDDTDDIADYIRQCDAQGELQSVFKLVDERAEHFDLDDPFAPGGLHYLQPMPLGEIGVFQRWFTLDNAGKIQLAEALPDPKQPHLACSEITVPGYEGLLALSQNGAFLIRDALKAWAFAPTLASDKQGQRRLYGKAA